MKKLKWIAMALLLIAGGYFVVCKFLTNQKTGGFNMALVLKEIPMSNGMQLITYESHQVPLVTIVISVKAGGMTETVETSGLTHLWEHMFFKGNQKLKDEAAFKKRLRQLGIDYNGDTDSERVRYFITLPSSLVEEGIEFMADAIATPLLDQGELDREIKVVLNEYERNASSPMFEYMNLRRALIYGDKAHHRDALGLLSTINNATREKMFAIKEQTMVPNNSALIIGGDIDPEKVKELVEKHFKIWQTPKNWQPIPDNSFPEFPSQYKNLVLYNDHVPVPFFSMSYDGPKARREEKDSHVIDVLLQLLSKESSKFQENFMDSGLIFDGGLGYYTQSQAGMIQIYAQAHRSKLKDLQERFLQEIKAWAEPGYFSEQQLEDVRRAIIIDHKSELAKPSAFTKELGFWWAVTGLDYFNRYVEGVVNVTLKDVQEAVKKWLIDKPYVSMTVLSSQQAKEIGLEENTDELIQKLLTPYYGSRINRVEAKK